MTKFAAFLRGVNVGGVNLKMAEVAAALEQAGFTNVKTILASGNVLFESRSGVDAVRKKAEKALRDEFGYDAWVLAYDLDTVRAISDKFPFEREVDGHHSYVTFVTDADVLDELAALAKDAGPDEKIKRVATGTADWTYTLPAVALQPYLGLIGKFGLNYSRFFITPGFTTSAENARFTTRSVSSTSVR